MCNSKAFCLFQGQAFFSTQIFIVSKKSSNIRRCFLSFKVTEVCQAILVSPCPYSLVKLLLGLKYTLWDISLFAKIFIPYNMSIYHVLVSYNCTVYVYNFKLF